MGFFDFDATSNSDVKTALKAHYDKGLSARDDVIDILKDADAGALIDVHVHHDLQGDPVFWARLIHQDSTYEQWVHDDIRHSFDYKDAAVACEMLSVSNDAPIPMWDEIELYFGGATPTPEPDVVIHEPEPETPYVIVVDQESREQYRQKQMTTLQHKIETFDVMATSFRMQGKTAQSLWAEEQRDAATHYLGEHYPESQTWITDRASQNISQDQVNTYLRTEQRQTQFNQMLRGDDNALITHLTQHPEDYRFVMEDSRRYFDLDFNAKVAVASPQCVQAMHIDVSEDILFERKVADLVAHSLSGCQDIDVIANAVADHPMVFDRLPIEQQRDPYLVANCIKASEWKDVAELDMPTYFCDNQPQRDAFEHLVETVRSGSYQQQMDALEVLQNPPVIESIHEVIEPVVDDTPYYDYNR